MAIRTGGLLSCASKARVAAKKIPETAERTMFINGLVFEHCHLRRKKIADACDRMMNGKDSLFGTLIAGH